MITDHLMDLSLWWSGDSCASVTRVMLVMLVECKQLLGPRMVDRSKDKGQTNIEHIFPEVKNEFT